MEATENRIVITRLIEATPEEIFDAWMDPESLRVWMCPGPVRTAVATVDPRVGGKFRILMKGADTDYDHTGEYTVVDRPRRLAFTWISQATGMRPTQVTIELAPMGPRTQLTLTHDGLRPEAVPSHTDGWRQIADKLGAHLARRNGRGGSSP